jgi:hypothetical protein
MEKVYVHIGKKADGTLVHHTSLDAMRDLDGVTTVLKKVALDEFEAKGSIVREINGKIFIGKTNAEIEAEQGQGRIIELKRKLAETDYVTAKIAEGAATKDEYSGVITQRSAWRSEIASLEGKTA